MGLGHRQEFFKHGGIVKRGVAITDHNIQLARGNGPLQHPKREPGHADESTLSLGAEVIERPPSFIKDPFEVWLEFDVVGLKNVDMVRLQEPQRNFTAANNSIKGKVKNILGNAACLGGKDNFLAPTALQTPSKISSLRPPRNRG